MTLLISILWYVVLITSVSMNVVHRFLVYNRGAKKVKKKIGKENVTDEGTMKMKNIREIYFMCSLHYDGNNVK